MIWLCVYVVLLFCQIYTFLKVATREEENRPTQGYMLISLMCICYWGYKVYVSMGAVM